MSIVLIVIAILVTIGAGYLLIKGKPPVMVLLFAGLLMCGLTLLLDPATTILDEEATSGSRWLDLVGLVEGVAVKQLSGVGLIIMAAGGFSTYMGKIGASRALVEVAAKPLARLRKPYVILVLAYFIGCALFLVIPSAAGLALLLLVTLFPILKAAGVTAAAAGAVIAAVSALPMGPAAGTSNLAADTAGMSTAVYFVQHQLPIAIPTLIAIAATMYFTQRYFDKRDAAAGVIELVEDSAAEGPLAPKFYSIFVVLPIILLIIFSPLVNQSVEMSTVTGFVLVWLLTVIVDLIRRRDLAGVFNDGKHFFIGMGKMFGTIVSLIIAAQIFAEGLKMTGLISGMIDLAQSANAPVAVMAILLTIVVGLVTFLTGSGVGAFSAFAPLAPTIATEMGGTATSILTPMQFASGMFRSMSPISGVVIAVSGAIGVSPLAIVKRTAPAMIVGALVTIVMSVIAG